MPGEQAATTEVLVLRDEGGSIFVLPRAVLEAYRASEEQTRDLERYFRAAAQDVEGFASLNPQPLPPGRSLKIISLSWLDLPSYEPGPVH